jgi:predicted nucleic acid-binding Zn ribbon protein
MKRRKTPQPIAPLLESVLKTHGYLSVCREHEVMHKWSSIVGERVAAVSRCTGVKEGVLFVHVRSAPWRQEISFMKGEILERIRAQTRCTSIVDIVFH